MATAQKKKSIIGMVLNTARNLTESIEVTSETVLLGTQALNDKTREEFNLPAKLKR